jgi:UDP-N-acetylglucosamine 1-carboxyvinyltransferase
MIAVSVASDASLRIRNLPDVEDVEVMSAIIERLGGEARRQEGSLRLATSMLRDHRVSGELSARVHGALYFLPGLLARFGRVELAACGGCRIGDTRAGGRRPVHHLVSVLERFGASFQMQGERLIGRCRGLRACTIDVRDYSDRCDLLTGPLVSGATKTAILAAASARGVTRILHPYPKPDVTELLRTLRALGHELRLQGDVLEIEPTAVPRAAEVRLMSDISEIVTWLALGAFHGIAVEIKDVTAPEVRAGLRPELELLGRMGIVPELGVDSLRIARVARIQSVDVEVTSVGIYSDHQPFFALLLLRGDRPATIREHVWKDRFQYVGELRKLGLPLSVDGDRLSIVPGTPSIAGQTLHGADVRGVAALVIAALAVDGPTRVEGTGHLRRGYGDFFGNLAALGARVEAL